MIKNLMRNASALAIALVCATSAIAEGVAVLLLDSSDPNLQQFDPEAFNIRPLVGAHLLLSRAETEWPASARPHRSTADGLLFLLEDHGQGGLPDHEGVETLQSAGNYRIVRASQDAARSLMTGAHGERLQWSRRRGPKSSAMALHPKRAVDPAVKTAIVEAVDASTYELYVRELSGDQSFQLDGQTETIPERHTFRPGVDLAADYLQDRLEGWGYTVLRQTFPVPPPSGTPAQNIIAIKLGSLAPQEIVVVGAHYDSISSADNSDGPAPGAEDNGSGTAAVLHLAEVFADYPTEKTVHFVLFGGEEQGLFGSSHYVNNPMQFDDVILAALTMDMMSAHQSNYQIDIEGWADGDPCDCWDLMQQFETEINAVSPALLTDFYYPGFGSDHVPFRNAQIPVLLAIESDYADYPGYHRTTDTVEKLDFIFGSLVVRGMAAMLAELSQVGEKVSVLLSGFYLDSNAGGVRLEWDLRTDEAGHLRLDRSVEDGSFLPVESARWRLEEQPGGFFDARSVETNGRRLAYRLVVERNGLDEILDVRETKLESRIAGGMLLHAAEPNPFGASGGTLLRFELARASDVSLDVYDAAGRHLRRLIEGPRRAGPHSVRWNGRDKQGRSMASGIYFVRLRGELEEQTRRLTLLGSAP